MKTLVLTCHSCGSEPEVLRFMGQEYYSCSNGMCQKYEKVVTLDEWNNIQLSEAIEFSKKVRDEDF